MSLAPFFLLAVEFEDVVESWRSLRLSSFSGMLVFAAIGMVTVLLVLWAAYFRKRRRRRSHHHTHQQSSIAAEPLRISNNGHAPSSPDRHRKRRHSRRKHRSRNPTLAETGGLPAIRPNNGPPAP